MILVIFYIGINFFVKIVKYYKKLKLTIVIFRKVIQGMSFLINNKELIEKIYKIRKEIGHDDIKINIHETIYKEDNKELWIITKDRPDKSTIIGKGGWVVGKLKEEVNINTIHVESYPDYITKKYRMQLSLETLNDFTKENPEIAKNSLKNLKETLNDRINNIYTFNLEEYLKNKKYEEKEHEAIIALSGGADSTFSIIIAKMLGFNPIAITVDPGTIVLPKQFKENIENITQTLNIKHQYIKVDYGDIIENSLNGTYHPCGRCSKVIEEEVNKYSQKHNIPLVIYGDMLSTGTQCITKQAENVYRLNLPATISSTKTEHKRLNKKYNIKSIEGYGCPLLYEAHKKNPHMKKYSIQRILRETRSNVLEPGEALKLIWSFYKTK